MKTIKINGKNYNLKQTIRSLFVYERVFGRTMTIATTEDTFMYLWATIKANNEDSLTYDEFLDWVDEAPQERTNQIISLMGEIAAENEGMTSAEGKKKAKASK